MKRLILIVLFLTKTLLSQIDTLNKYNSKGKKHGYWKQYLDVNGNPIDSSNSYFFYYSYYNNGDAPIQVFKQKSNNGKSAYPASKLEKGKPILLNDTLKWYDQVTLKLTQIKIFSCGHPIREEYYSNYKNNKDNNVVVIEFVDYTKRYNNEVGSFYYKNTSPSSMKYDEYWFRKVKGKWRFDKIKQ